jgi:hypothetical protein
MTSGLWRCVELQDVSVEVKNLNLPRHSAGIAHKLVTST